MLAMFGKAPCCGSPVSVLYPLGEILGAVVVVWPLTRFGVGVDSALAFVFLSALFVASGIDLHRRWLPDILTLPLLWLGLLANIDARFATLPDAVLGAAGGYLGMRILAGIFGYAVRRRAMGGGDFKLSRGAGRVARMARVAVFNFHRVAVVAGVLAGGVFVFP